MKSILLIGVGRFGRRIVQRLTAMNVEVMAVDCQEERVQAVAPYAAKVLVGDASNAEFLRSLGVRNFDACIVAIGDNFLSSLEVTSLLKELGAKRVISRAARDTQEKFLLRNGADEVVYPEGQLAAWTAIRHTTDHVLDYIALDSEYAIYDLSVPGEWVGKTVGALDIRKKYHLNLLAVRENGQPSTAVTSDTVLEAHQTILVLGKWKDIQKCFRI